MGGLTTRLLTSRRERKTRNSFSGQLQAGDMLQNRYKITGILGSGGFSSVYQARDMRFPNVTKLCAIKEMVHVSADQNIRELTTKSFEREANILATLDHPAVVDVYDYFTEDDRSYLVLEFIRGKDLESMMAEQTDFVPLNTVLDWALQICDVLAYLHNLKPQAVVFRDMKPSNIMLDPQGRIRLIDFNIAKIFQSDDKNTTIGTEGYAPPEQYRGEASPAGDVYGLGATLHHILTRQDPRMEPPFSFAERPVRAANPNVPAELETIIMRSVAYNGNDRYANAIDLKQALLTIVQSPTAQTGVLLPIAPQPTPTNHRPIQIAAPDAILHKPAVATIEPPAVAQVKENSVKPVWVFKCEDEIRSTPAVADGTVFAGVYDNNLYAISAADGKFLWKMPAADGIASSPYVYQDMVFIGSADKYLYCVRTHSGRLHWRYAAGGPIYSSPRVKFDHVFFGSDDNHLYAVNITSGRMAWKVDGFTQVRSSPFITDEHVLFGTEGGYVFCVDLAGRNKWQFQARRAVTSTPVVAEDMVFVGSMDNTVYSLDINSGWAIWRFRAARPIISSPVIHDNILYIGSSDGSLYALDTFSGKKIWQYETKGQISSSPAIWGDAVYFGSTDGSIYSLDHRRGRLRWRFETGNLVVSSPCIVDGIVYIGSADHHLYALPA